MSPLSIITDGYERKARLYPALVLLAPVVVTLLATMGAELSAFQSVAGIAAACGGAFLLSQLVRDAGKRREKRLFTQWGGMPSVVIFRHRDTRIDSVTKARYHKKLASVVKGCKAPSAQSEGADPAAADEVYSAWSTYVRVNTRNTEKYPLLFNENVSYGYRRNVLGLRPFGIVICGVACLITAVLLYRHFQTVGQIKEELAAALVFDTVLLLLWLFRFSAGWVRLPADAYAERLSEAVDTVGEKMTAAKK